MQATSKIPLLIGTVLIFASCGKGLQTPFIPLPPQSVTQAALALGSSKAILHGEVNPQGIETVAWFEWGPTSDYGNVAPTQSIGNGTSPLPVTQSLIDLLPNAIYHYRVVAQNGAGTTLGADTALTTLGITAPAVASEAATVITKTGATLQGTINPNGFITNGWFEWGLTPLYGNITPKQSVGNGSGAAALQQAIGALGPSTIYHYRAVGENGGGISAGHDQTFATLAATLNTPTVLSTAPANLAHTTATFTGTVNPNGLSSVAYFEWGASAAYGNITPAQSVGAGSMAAPVSQAISGLQVGVVYHYRIVGENSDGASIGNDQTFTPVPYQAQAYLSDPNGAVSVVDLATHTIAKTVAMTNPVAAAATPDGRKVYVVNASSATVSVIETIGNTVTATIPVAFDPTFGTPLQSIGVTPDGTEAYVGGNRDLSVIDTATDTLKTTIPSAGGQVYKFLFASSGTRFYAVGIDLWVIDPRSNQIKDELIGTNANWALSPDESRLYQISYGKSAALNAYSTATDGFIGTISGLAGLKLLVSPDGAKVYVSQNTGNLAIVDATTMTLSKTLAGVGGSDPFVSSGGKIYAGSLTGATIAVMDIATDSVTKTLTPSGPTGKALSFGNLIYFIQANGSQIGIIDVPTDALQAPIFAPANDIAISAR